MKNENDAKNSIARETAFAADDWVARAEALSRDFRELIHLLVQNAPICEYIERL